jgi:hypothetical protein
LGRRLERLLVERLVVGIVERLVVGLDELERRRRLRALAKIELTRRSRPFVGLVAPGSTRSMELLAQLRVRAAVVVVVFLGILRAPSLAAP